MPGPALLLVRPDHAEDWEGPPPRRRPAPAEPQLNPTFTSNPTQTTSLDRRADPPPHDSSDQQGHDCLVPVLPAGLLWLPQRTPGAAPVASQPVSPTAGSAVAAQRALLGSASFGRARRRQAKLGARRTLRAPPSGRQASFRSTSAGPRTWSNSKRADRGGKRGNLIDRRVLSRRSRGEAWLMEQSIGRVQG